MSNPNALVSKLWNYCSILRDDGLSYGDYVEQLTFLLFLKMADEQSKSPYLSEDKRRDAASTSRHDRKETERFKSFDYEDLIKRDKINLDIFWLKDDALEESANLPAPGVIAQDIMEDLQAALEQFATIAEDLKVEV